jgi:hypothetical protein
MDTRESGLQDGAELEAQSDLSGAQAEAGGAEESGQAQRAVMHPDWHDAEWRYYFGAWHS